LRRRQHRLCLRQQRRRAHAHVGHVHRGCGCVWYHVELHDGARQLRDLVNTRVQRRADEVRACSHATTVHA
jgi:hypothetical protein